MTSHARASCTVSVFRIVESGCEITMIGTKSDVAAGKRFVATRDM